MTCLFPSSGKENKLLKRVFEIHRTDWKQKRFENVPVMINKRQPSQLNSIKYPHKLPGELLGSKFQLFGRKKKRLCSLELCELKNGRYVLRAVTSMFFEGHGYEQLEGCGQIPLPSEKLRQKSTIFGDSHYAVTN